MTDATDRPPEGRADGGTGAWRARDEEYDPGDLDPFEVRRLNPETWLLATVRP
jgi:hypothetical protein